MSAHTTAWYVTSANAPYRRLAGPYVSRDECERVCITMTDTHSTLSAIAEGKLPGYYLPRPFREEVNANQRTRSANELLRDRVTQDANSTLTRSGTDRAYVSTSPSVNAKPGEDVQTVRSRRKPNIRLPDNIFKLSRSEILDLAITLGMEAKQLAALKPNKHELVKLLEAYLSS